MLEITYQELINSGISKELISRLEKAEEKCKVEFKKIDEIAEYNQIKVLKAFQECGLSSYHFHGTTGYGLDDDGRQVIDRIVARIYRAESAMLRWQFVSGTHTISSVLFGNLRPGDELLSVTGSPYDTLGMVIGDDSLKTGTLKEWGINYKEACLKEGRINFEKIKENIIPATKMIYLQRSGGYSLRKAITIDEIKEAVNFIKNIKGDIIIMVDNCYGEFTETMEPIEAGADIIAGSLIKNFGGTLAPCGGYIAGREELVKRAAQNFTAPGIEDKVGSTLDFNRTILHGIFLAPQVVREALKGASLAGSFFESLGLETMPGFCDKRSDIIQGVVLNNPEAQAAFCRGVQKASPVDSSAYPKPARQPGYKDLILMAGGTFISGSSIEFSCDGPLRPPHAVFIQGGTSIYHIKLGLLLALQELINENLFK